MIDDNVIYKEVIFLDKELNDKESIIDFILKEAESNHLILEANDLKDAVLAREKEISTSIGFDIAMPHGKSATVQKPFVAFLRAADNFYWDTGADETVRLVFLIAVPSENKDNMHLKFISQISKKLLNDEFRDTLLSENDSNVVYELLKSIKQN